MSRKYTRKQLKLKQPDEFISASMRVWSFVGDHASQVLITVGIAAVIVGAFWTWNHFATRRGEKATAQLTRATDIYNQTIAPTETKVPTTDEDGLPRFKTRAEKLKAAEEEYGKVVEQGGAMAVVARGMRAGVRYDAGKFAEAIDDYKKVLEKTGDQRLRTLAIEGLAYCYEAQKDYGKALQQFRLLPRDGDKKYLALYQEARVLAKKGDVKEAASIYKEIISKGAPATLVDRASDRLALLEGKLIRSPALLLLTLLGGCAANYRLDETTPPSAEPPREVLQLRWHKQLVEREFMDYKPQEWASAAIDEARVVYVGSSAGRFLAIDGISGRIRWTFDTEGAIASAPLVDGPSSTVFFGSDDGKMYALDTRDGTKRWSYATQGTINRTPALSDGTLLFTSSEGRIYALDAKNGVWRWQYDREIPEGFTIQGYAGVAVNGSVAYTGFTDGTLVALRVFSGDVLWTKSLAGGKTQFIDVDSTPVAAAPDLLLAASYAGGVFAVSPDSGSIRWQYPLEGATSIFVHGSSIYCSAPKVGLVALDMTGHQRWRQAMARGVPAAPVGVGAYLFLTGTESGLFAASFSTGRLLQYFDPGHGISATPAVGAGLLVVLTNEGWLYAFRIVPPTLRPPELG